MINKIKGLMIVSALLVAFNTFGQNKNFGVGVRAGDPSGVSLKKYFSSGNAFELNIGRSHMFYRNGWYDKHFNDWYNDWNEGNKYNYTDYQYLGYDRSLPVSIQGRYLFQKDLKQVPNLQWYWGVGGQLRFQSYKYSYRYKVFGNPNWIHSTEKVTDIDIGADGILGLEYTFEELPLSVFGDINLFLEFADNPFAIWGQGGLGIRYNF